MTAVQFRRDVDPHKVIVGLFLLKTGTTLANFDTLGNNHPWKTTILMIPSVLVYRGLLLTGL